MTRDSRLIAMPTLAFALCQLGTSRVLPGRRRGWPGGDRILPVRVPRRTEQILHIARSTQMSESPQEPSVAGMPLREKGLSRPGTRVPGWGLLFHSIRMWTWVLLLAGIALTSAHALTKVPHGDEGDLASAAASLLDRGRIAFPMEYAYLPSMRQQIYLSPPFY